MTRLDVLRMIGVWGFFLGAGVGIGATGEPWVVWLAGGLGWGAFGAAWLAHLWTERRAS